MTNREAYNGFLSIASDALDKIHRMKGFVKDNSHLHKREHKVAVESMQEAMIIAAKCHMLKENFFSDPTIKKIIDKHPENEEYWNWLKLTSMGHL